MTTVLEPAPRADAGVDRRVTAWALLVGVVVAVAGVFGFAFVGRGSFSLDETVSTTLADAPWHQFSQTVVHREANMSLYYLLLRGWIGLGHGEAVVRTLSVLMTLVAVALVMELARALFGRRTAVLCGLLLAVDPVVVMFAQDARGYALSLMLVTASSVLFVRGLRSPSGWGTWAAYACVSALAAYANFWAALVPLSHAVSLTFLPRRRVPWRRVVPAGVACVTLLVPLALLIRATDASGVDWAAGSTAGRLFTAVRRAVPHPLIDVGVVAVVVLAVAAVAAARRRPRAAQILADWPLVFVVCWAVVPVATVVLLSLVDRPLVVVRYLVVCVPPLAVVLSYGVARLGRRALTTTVGALVAVSGLGLGFWYAHGTPQDWRGAVAFVAARAQPGDGVVVFASYTRIPFEWYLQEHPAAERRLRPVFPPGPWGHDPLQFDAFLTVPRAALAGAGSGRLWLVLSQQQLYTVPYRELLTDLRSVGLVASGARRFPGVRVVEYTPGHP